MSAVTAAIEVRDVNRIQKQHIVQFVGGGYHERLLEK